MFKSCISMLALASAVTAIAPRQEEECKTIAQLATETPELSTLLDLVVKADLAEALSDPTTTLTVFAPTNAAFEKVDAATLEFLSDPDNIAALTDVLIYHVYPDAVSSDLAMDGMMIEMLNGDEASISVAEDGSVMINDALVITADISACGGSYVHIIDTVLIPPVDDGMSTSDGEDMDMGMDAMESGDAMESAMESGDVMESGSAMESGDVMESDAVSESGETCMTVAEIAMATPELTTLVEAVVAAGLVDALSDPESTMTVFAPTNDAFAALNPATLASLMEEESVASLIEILTYHVLPGVGVMAADAADGDITMMNMQDATISVVDGEVFINDAKVVMADIPACGGSVIHVIDMVLIPAIE
ncbi:hypothetical protein SARC_04148 [Sphaeroforma arctica JP610]|uniref:FAS1 domain-containing protein n=1 Tax=Sphaeroforma arctica JP610 TaxID=667725 RepID=A0A0L0G5X3_9EUKA|nr:hypothetical protein SARC_04148 [Sphaeroforma arctica JP610]KNC83613.1 hypothetical protein SARC_04148 [Sphaeroforma arctica JP610]|eukprot:XP_014157515.1 hypothetical protein SARC_04148 [Sphaeroforma arctica JP610]